MVQVRYQLYHQLVCLLDDRMETTTNHNVTSVFKYIKLSFLCKVTFISNHPSPPARCIDASPRS
jgi:hypothetical protein